MDNAMFKTIVLMASFVTSLVHNVGAFTNEDFKNIDKIHKIQSKMLAELGSGKPTMTIEEVEKISQDPAGSWSDPMTAAMLSRYIALIKHNQNWANDTITRIKEHGLAEYIGDVWKLLEGKGTNQFGMIQSKNYADDETKENFEKINAEIKNEDIDINDTFRNMLSLSDEDKKGELLNMQNQLIKAWSESLFQIINIINKRNDLQAQEKNMSVFNKLIEKMSQNNKKIIQTLHSELKKMQDGSSLGYMAKSVRGFEIGRTTQDEVVSKLGSPLSSNIRKKVDSEIWTYIYNPPEGYSVRVVVNFNTVGKVEGVSVIKTEGGAETELIHSGNR